MVDLKEIASRLAGVNATEVVPAASGGNSRVYKVTTPDRAYALKQYPSIVSDPRDRLNTERRALGLMQQHDIRSVPKWIAAEPPYALMGWVDGAIIKDPTSSDIDHAAAFLGTLHRISKKTPEKDLPLASEACLSGQSIVNQVEARIKKLQSVAKENPALAGFLSGNFEPTLTTRLQTAKNYSGFSKELPFNESTLIAADFGFHNIMRANDGTLTFIDFEYFGWDDPVKLMADFLLHPATPLTPELKKQFYSHTLGIYGDGVRARFTAYYPLFGLRWSLILLNEFLPERWQARASRDGQDWEQVKIRQLEKAKAMLIMSEKFE